MKIIATAKIIATRTSCLFEAPAWGEADCVDIGGSWNGVTGRWCNHPGSAEIAPPYRATASRTPPLRKELRHGPKGRPPRRARLVGCRGIRRRAVAAADAHRDRDLPRRHERRRRPSAQVPQRRCGPAPLQGRHPGHHEPAARHVQPPNRAGACQLPDHEGRRVRQGGGRLPRRVPDEGGKLYVTLPLDFAATTSNGTVL